MWVRHGVYWALAVALLLLSVLDDDPGRVAETNADDDVALFVWLAVVVLLVAVVALVFTLKEWQDAGVVRTLSRSLVLLVMLLGFVSAWLFTARQWGVEILGCQVVRNQEVCRTEASPRQVAGMLAWNAADVIPVVKATESFGWERPARSESAVVGASLVLVRLWVAIGVLGVVKVLWDSWGLTSSPPQRSGAEPDRDTG